MITLSRKHRALVAAFADPHCGHSLGLLDPDTLLEAPCNPRITDNPHITQTQEYLWNRYIEYVEDIRIWAGRDPVLLILAGDWMHGTKYSNQLMSLRSSDQTRIAVDIMRPWFKLRNLKAIRPAQGTPAHDPVGSLTLDAFHLLRAEHSGVDIEASLHTLATLNGVDVDFTHKGPHPGSRKWLEGNIVRYNLKDMMLKDIAYGVEPARIYIRAHRHEYRHEVAEVYGEPDRKSDLYLLPSFCGMGYYAKNATSEYRLTTGMVAWEIIDGEFVRDKVLKHVLDIREKEVFEW